MNRYSLKAVMVYYMLCFCGTVFAQNAAYIKRYRPLADSLSEAYGIPAAVILGVAVVESSGGAGRTVKLLNNHFGIVGRNQLMKTKKIKTRYKQYSNATASYIDFCNLMTRKRFYNRLKGNNNWQLWVPAISKSGYSEVPAVWQQRVSAVIKKNKLYTAIQ
ncbi:MAG TPA: glucosaminidase domain-containing protein [Ferruginibacter sp.]|nr:glucosaminidase domain-containing protein [Ferruginibacter sp.]HMP21502.1 glucosaminidase domain-containing protein [Ferruginibacter sp.]